MAEEKDVAADFADGRDLHLCVVGVDKHWVEKDLIKFLRKSFSQKKPAPENSEEGKGEDEIPLKGVAKKRGKQFGFLQFSNIVEKTDFKELFASTIAPFKRYRLRDCDKIDKNKGFKPVKGSDEMAQDSLQRKLKQQASVTQADVDAVLAESIEERVTPFAKYPYAE